MHCISSTIRGRVRQYWIEVAALRCNQLCVHQSRDVFTSITTSIIQCLVLPPTYRSSLEAWPAHHRMCGCTLPARCWPPAPDGSGTPRTGAWRRGRSPRPTGAPSRPVWSGWWRMSSSLSWRRGKVWLPLFNLNFGCSVVEDDDVWVLV